MTDSREQFSSQELAIVLTNYDLGIVSEAREFPKGSHAAAKVLVVTDRGKFLLKRRPPGKDDPYKVAFAHALQNYLADQHFPLPHLVGTRETNNSMLKVGSAIYEVFEFIEGEPYDGGLLGTYQAGKTLGLYHRLVKDYRPEWDPPPGSYHGSKTVYDTIPKMAAALAKAGGAGREAEAQRVLIEIREAYATSATAANEMGLLKWPTQIIHSDWHPGNMIFDKGHVVAVIDYDAARVGPRVIDIANGCLQFSFTAGGRKVSAWSDETDVLRGKRFLRGYDEMNVLTHAELAVVPRLMEEAMIAQAVPPILKTGTFARLDGLEYLKVVLRKVAWLRTNGGRLQIDEEE